MSLEGAQAANRFGLGARPGEIEDASNDPKAWLKDQLRHDDTVDRFAGLPRSRDLVADLISQRQARQGKDREAIKTFLMAARQTYLREMAARFRAGFETAQPLRERLVRFWSNHFVVSI